MIMVSLWSLQIQSGGNLYVSSRNTTCKISEHECYVAQLSKPITTTMLSAFVLFSPGPSEKKVNRLSNVGKTKEGDMSTFVVSVLVFAI
mmetsp:Transcript_12925/g.30209  ORF Transcript_12925/g.30209 Transcript_12925/m.30209 type:complete len:89 (-) Transcript_12925:47-313(-)